MIELCLEVETASVSANILREEGILQKDFKQELTEFWRLNFILPDSQEWNVTWSRDCIHSDKIMKNTPIFRGLKVIWYYWDKK